jgi:large subunit ribosomal protein L29
MKQNAVISEMTLEELKDGIAEKVDKLTKMRIQHTVSPLEDANQLAGARKSVARLKTELRRREIEAQKQA